MSAKTIFLLAAATAVTCKHSLHVTTRYHGIAHLAPAVSAGEAMYRLVAPNAVVAGGVILCHQLVIMLFKFTKHTEIKLTLLHTTQMVPTLSSVAHV